MISNCSACCHCVYDEETDSYFCDVDMDEDEVVRFYTDKRNECPYYDDNDEYKLVRHQI